MLAAADITVIADRKKALLWRVTLEARPGELLARRRDSAGKLLTAGIEHRPQIEAAAARRLR